MQSKAQILQDFALFSVPTGGIGNWLTEKRHDDIFERLGKIDADPLPAVQLNQLLVLGHVAPLADGFFRYYWLQAPDRHPYSVRDVPGFSDAFVQSGGLIVSLAHLKWGLYRLYIDALLYSETFARPFGACETSHSQTLRPFSNPRGSTQKRSSSAARFFP